MKEWTDGWKDEQVDGWKDEQVDGWKDEQMDGWIDRWKDQERMKARQDQQWQIICPVTRLIFVLNCLFMNFSLNLFL